MSTQPFSALAPPNWKSKLPRLLMRVPACAPQATAGKPGRTEPLRALKIGLSRKPALVPESCSPDPSLSRPDAAGMRTAGQRLLVFLLSLYKVFLSPLLPSSCKFYPTCSTYAQQAVEQHGAARGLRLALSRLLRCRPFSRGGYDPVPDV